MNRKSRKQQTVVKEYVTIAFAEDLELAREYEKMLTEHGIPAVVKNQPKSDEDGYSGIAVTVPEEFVDEAYTMIRDESSYDDFFDAAFDSHDSFEEKEMLFCEEEEEETDEYDNY